MPFYIDHGSGAGETSIVHLAPDSKMSLCKVSVAGLPVVAWPAAPFASFCLKCEEIRGRSNG